MVYYHIVFLHSSECACLLVRPNLNTWLCLDVRVVVITLASIRIDLAIDDRATLYLRHSPSTLHGSQGRTLALPRVDTLDDIITFEVSFTDLSATFVIEDYLSARLLKVHLHATTFEVVGIYTVGLVPISHTVIF
jgi:hypothetical protein